MIVRKKIWHIRNAVVFYYEEKISDMREQLLTRGAVYILRIGRPKIDPSYFFLL